MAKTWETLFNLSSFMKYLLAEVLPDEKVESPSYVLDSLYELLTVTVSCIEKIKSDPKNIKREGTLASSSVEEITSFKTIKGSKRDYKEANTDSSSNLLGNYVSHTPHSISKEEQIINKIMPLENRTKQLIIEGFVKISNEMLNGSPFGYYCRPCDIAIFSKKMWDKHSSDKLHIFLKENCEHRLVSCSYCNLIIFSTLIEAEQLLNYHIKQHTSNLNCPITDDNCIETKYETDNNGKTFERVNDLEDVSGLEMKSTISPLFIELDKQIHSGKKVGFYCHICDKVFDVVTQWNSHFQDEESHINQSDGCFEKCEDCKLIIFAIPSIQAIYKIYHQRGHNRIRDRGKFKKSNTRSSMENIYLTSCDQNFQEYYKSRGNKGDSNRIFSNTYVICDQFQHFNAKIHASNLHGCFYCRPCNATLNSDEWTKHSTEKKHLQLMGNRKFINWKGICAYCSLTIIGTRETVKYYMIHHNKDHQKILSYDEERISPSDRKATTREKRSRNRRASPSSSVSTLGDTEPILEDYDVDEGNSDDSNIEEDTEIKQAFVNVSNFVSNTESSRYSSSKEEQLHFLVFKLIDSRIDQKQKTGKTSFGALCMICETTFKSRSAWNDHLRDADHLQKISSMDGQALINDFNIILYGNIDVLEKYKAMVKGNMTFITN